MLFSFIMVDRLRLGDPKACSSTFILVYIISEEHIAAVVKLK